ncbi:TPA: hypothetical protein ACOEBL_001117 [Enterobacter cloacae]|uniref:hypothetical protein n=1 Tax=Enterobacter TaxID=547 RepID=UPI0007358C70|nr:MULTISPECIES: hypothetical protein [Enterobacter]KTI37607.1 hypothetical protein ASV06_12650 [Enterobacter hormaechei subsp. xiangfangensis]MBY4585153.1 hypothetical protein [Enterobacter hormaechei]
MPAIEESIEDLYVKIEELHLELHAARVAITVLSSALNGICGKPGHLAEVVEEGMSQAGPLHFDFPVEDGYEAKLNTKVLALLSKQD